MEKDINLQPLLHYGPFSEIDIHFARLIHRLAGRQEVPELALAAALASYATSQGHVCLDLSSVEDQLLMTHDPEIDDFSHQELPKLAEWRKRLESSGVVGRPGDERPLILDDRSRLYLYRYWQYEKALADDIKARAATEIEKIDVPLLKDRLSRLFPQTRDKETDWQKLASFVSVTKRFCVISGGPGTGKSSTVARLLALILETNKTNEMRIALAAPTGKAAARLQETVKNGKETLRIDDRIKESIVAKASTIHRLLGAVPGSPYFRHNAENPLPVDMVIIDEASMVDLALMSKLVQAIPPNARLVLLGDKDQLSSVEAGAVLGDICDTGRTHGLSQKVCDKFREISGDQVDISPKGCNGPDIGDCVVQLKKTFRFGTHSGIGAVSHAVNKGDGNLALGLLKDSRYKDVKWKTLPASKVLRQALKVDVIKGYRPYLQATEPMEISRLFEQFRLLCAPRRGPYGVSALNLIVEQILREENLITTGKRWYRGLPVLIRKNDYNLGLFNGDTGIILPDPESNNDLRAFFLSPNRTLRKMLPARLPDHETVYAMTVHKSQGSEFDKALLILPDKFTPLLTRELTYTAITRAKQSVQVWGTESVFVQGVSRRIERASGLRDALWET